LPKAISRFFENEVELFKFRLAGHLGLTLFELTQKMTGKELLGWWQYAQVEPFGYVQQELKTAQIRADILNSSGALKEAVSPLDLMPERFNKKDDVNQETQECNGVVEWLMS
jgi:hypothetical protein